MSFKTALFILIGLIAFACQPKETIEIKSDYLPNHHYTFIQEQNVVNTITYDGPQEVLAEILEDGRNNPTVNKNNNSYYYTIKTKNMRGAGVPLELEFIETSDPGLPGGLKFFGTYVFEEVFFDSVAAKTVDENQRRGLLYYAQNLVTNNEYPRQSIQVGESFSQITPMEFPVGNVPIEIEINSKYTLKKVEDGRAYFDIVQVFTLLSDDNVTTLKGTGKGQTTFHIEKSFFTKFSSEMEMVLKTRVETMDITIDVKSETNHKTEIRGN
ncbi:MAG: hypothetical protein JJU02_02940 [Cryomorphaceae bacterium]|nr:hypothetical protein [Cryomorphaceae bacterium]